MIEQIMHRLKILYSQYFTLNNTQTLNSIKLATYSKKCENVSLVPTGYSVDLGCAISVNKLFQMMTGEQIGGDSSTFNLQKSLIYSYRFVEVSSPLPGDIIISATGTARMIQTPVPHGHVGVVVSNGIMSNSSNSGLWQNNYNLVSWKKRYVDFGGYRMRYFRMI